MEIDIKKQQQAQAKAKALLAEQEKQRTELRLSKLILSLEQGESEVLLNNEFLSVLPQMIIDTCKGGDYERVKQLFVQLGECACSEELQIRERAVMALSLCSSLMLEDDPCGLMVELSRIMLRWLRIETSYLSSCDTVCKQLQQNGIRMLEEGNWKECDYLLDTFYQIQSGKLEKNNAIRSIVSRAQEAMAADYILEELTLVCLRGRGERRKNAESLLVHLGRKAAMHLLENLFTCQEKEHRLRLIGIIPATGYVSVAVLEEFLKRDLPWYAIRNVVLMLAAINDPKLIPLVMPYVDHKDIRVQQQVIDCIYDVAAENKKSYLLSALPLVDYELKGNLVVHLGQLGGEDTQEAFLDLLAHRDSFSDHVRFELLKKLIINIRLCKSKRAVNIINMVIDEMSSIADEKAAAVIKTAKQTLHILVPQVGAGENAPSGKSAPAAANEPSAPKSIVDTPPLTGKSAPVENYDNVSFAKDPVAEDKAKRVLQKINEDVAKLLGKGDVAGASQFLFEKCEEAAKDKEFETAEMLRDRILEVDPNGLTEVIRAGEIIEEERTSSITSHHITVWQDLYDKLSTDEFNALYYQLREKQFAAGDLIVEQGIVQPSLFFINSGQARLSCQRGDNEIFLKRINPGEIVGAAPFFEVSVWTTTLTAFTKSSVHILKRENFLELLEEHPALETSLQEYCTKLDTVPELLKMSGEDRRQGVRYPISSLVEHTLLDQYGNSSKKSFKGELADIAMGGLSFFIRISRKENARLLLGRKIASDVPLKGGGSVSCRGSIVAVRFQHYHGSDYSVHVQFDEPVEAETVKQIVGSE